MILERILEEFMEKVKKSPPELETELKEMKDVKIVFPQM